MRRRMLCVIIMFIFASLGISHLFASEQTHRVKVTIVRRESSIHTSISNQDVYIIQVLQRGGSTFVARMIDEYPSYAERLPSTSLKEGELFSIAMRRTPYCDQRSNDDADERADPSVRCFSMVHGSWRIPKDRAKDEWWK